MGKTVEQLQAELDREIAYTRKVNDKNAVLTDQINEFKKQLSDSISKVEHNKIVDALCKEYEHKLSKIKIQRSRTHNERGAGRKRIASKEVITKVMELRGQGLSQAKIAAKLSEKLQMKIGRTTVGEIVRGNYTPSNNE